jgi:hypothetical protein
MPSHGGDGGATAPPSAPVFGATTSKPLFGEPSPATRRAQAKAEAAVRPLAASFVDDLIHRRSLARAHALLGSKLREHYSLADWLRGRDLPLNTGQGAVAGGSDVAFSGPKMVGLVYTISPDHPGADDTLYALRFVKQNGWHIDFSHQGHSSRYVDAANFTPHGFLPGSSSGSSWSWLILVLGLIGLIAVVAIADRGLRGRRSPRDF